jgi:hypothetical protein
MVVPEAKLSDLVHFQNNADIKAKFFIFNDLGAFENAIVSEFKVNINFDSVIELSSDFLQSDEDYVVLNVKDNVAQEPNNF